MELCITCKQEKCSKNIVVTKKKNLTIIKCLEYQKDIEKVQGYLAPLIVTAKRNYVDFYER